MCGLSGAMSSWLSDTEERAFKELMMLSNFRGMEGSGVIATKPNADTTYHKCLKSSLHLFDEEEFKSIEAQRSSVLIGHTRFPTKGGVTYDSTHPHVAGHIIGVHNGTMQSIMNKGVPDGANDSKLLFEAIAEHGIDEAIKQSRGAYALMWIDLEARTFNVLRNDQRPLFFSKAYGGNTMFWSSESWMLHTVFARANWKPEVHSLKTDHLFSFELPFKGRLNESWSYELKRTPEVVSYTPPFQRTTYGVGFRGQKTQETEQTGNSGSSSGTETGNENNAQSSSSIQPKHIPQPTNRTVVPFVSGKSRNQLKREARQARREAARLSRQEAKAARRSLIEEEDPTPANEFRQTMRSNWVSAERYEELLHQGCQWCQGIAFSMEVVSWVDKDLYVCADCSHDTYVQSYTGCSPVEDQQEVILH
jgi:hypothetical protein